MTDDKPKGQNRFLLWVDAVGGYLVCTSHQIILGRAAPDSDVDVPILGDLSQRHAAIHRDGGRYLIEPLQETMVNGKATSDWIMLADGDRISLGRGVQLQFRQPHPWSATARLNLVSHHITQPRVDGVLLMADSCVLGPTPQSHVACRHWHHDLVLFCQTDGFYCLPTADVSLAGPPCSTPCSVVCGIPMESGDFSFFITPVEESP